MRAGKRCLAALGGILSCIVLLEGLNPLAAGADTLPTAEGKTKAEETVKAATANGVSYFSYYQTVMNQNRPASPVTVTADTAASEKTNESKGTMTQSIHLTQKGAWVEWTFKVSEAGAYSLYPTYCPLEGTGKDIQVSVYLDGSLPFDEAKELTLPRIWRDKGSPSADGYEKDSLGNDMRPEQIEAFRWHTVGFSDTLGMYDEPYLFYLTQGTHTLRVAYSQEPLAIQQMTFRNEDVRPSYAEYLKQYSKTDYATGESVRQEAEYALEKNAATLYPTTDRSTVGTQPNDPYHTKLNTIGGSNWSSAGTFISWTVNVPANGLYRLAFRARQNASEGLNAYRRLYINEKIPFAEAENIVFPYRQDWYLKTLGDDRPLLVYLKKGDVITLECTSGAMSLPLREVQQAVLDLNELYRKIIMITGTSPSIYQDYSLETQLPDLITDLTAACQRLHLAADAIQEELGKSSSAASTIIKALKVFEALADDSYYIPDRLSNFKGNIESLASLLLSLGGQPVELDCLFYLPAEAGNPSMKTSFFQDFTYGFQRFFATFTNDYNSIGSASLSKEKALLVWAGVGRDQAQILNRLIEEDFTRKTGIPVVLNLVSGDATLIKATLAGRGPDVSLTVASTTPVNLAARGALTNLNQFDLSQMKAQTYPSAWTPFEYRGGVYALPESQATELFFYRTDVFETLNMTPPKTWDEFYWMLEVLQSKNLQFGWTEVNAANQGSSLAISIFSRFLLQNGGNFYNAEQTKTCFDTEAAYTAFEKTVELYRTYGISRDLSFFNRFRSGDAPAGVSSYLFYTQLMATAPEIRGLWDFALMPGTKREDGTIDRTQTAGATGCVMMASAEKRGIAQEAFQFMSWWCGAEAQTAYGKELEGVLGIIGRTSPANQKALENLGWSEKELSIIRTQLQCSENIPEILGNYTVDRSLTSALRAAFNDKNTPRRSLAIYNKAINDEIARKRKEFKLD